MVGETEGYVCAKRRQGRREKSRVRNFILAIK
jgi:hypothetical protein